MTDCQHLAFKIVQGPFGKHSHKKVCENPNCNKWIAWHSVKTPEQKVIDRKKHIADYYKAHPEKNKFFKSTRDWDYAFD